VVVVLNDRQPDELLAIDEHAGQRRAAAEHADIARLYDLRGEDAAAALRRRQQGASG
jgi:hypothetical protein